MSLPIEPDSIEILTNAIRQLPIAIADNVHANRTHAHMQTKSLDTRRDTTNSISETPSGNGGARTKSKQYCKCDPTRLRLPTGVVDIISMSQSHVVCSDCFRPTRGLSSQRRHRRRRCGFGCGCGAERIKHMRPRDLLITTSAHCCCYCCCYCFLSDCRTHCSTH